MIPLTLWDWAEEASQLTQGRSGMCVCPSLSTTSSGGHLGGPTLSPFSNDVHVWGSKGALGWTLH